MKSTLPALVMVAFACGGARADWGYTTWGMTPEQVAAHAAGAVKVLPDAERTKSGSKPDDWEIAARGTFQDGPRVLDVAFMFDLKGGLRCVLYNARAGDVAPVKAELIGKYGPGVVSDYRRTHTITWDKPEQIELTIGDKPLAAVVMHCRPGG